MKNHSSRAAFTLVELAVVLTIIGLIIGGVVVGSDMIKSAGLNSIQSDVKRYQAAVNAFRDKYQYLPGDFPNAVGFWGSAGGTGLVTDTACQNVPTTSGTATCSGNGDGQVATGGEIYRFWQQLGNAGLIQGQYTGSAGQNSGYTTTQVIGINVPATRMSGIGIQVIYLGYTAGDAYDFAGNFGHAFRVMVNTGTYNILTPSDAYQFDTKFDDGLPGSGNIIGYKGDTTNTCTNMANVAVGSDSGAVYNTSNLNPVCQLNFVNAF